MTSKFHIGRGRYESLTTSRFRDYTYGEQNLIGENKDDQSLPEEHGTYGALLFDKRWKEKRVEILNRDNHACIICAESNNLQVHHRQYHFIKSLQQFKAPWDYENYLMITLCERCHSKGHSKYKVPIVYQ